MTKNLRKEITEWSMLRNKWLKSKYSIDGKTYNIQRNRSRKFLETNKKEYFNNLGIKKITDSRSYCVVPLRKVIKLS